MCGIVGYIGPQSVVPVIIEGLRRLEYRGYDSAGIAVAGGPEGLALRRAPAHARTPSPKKTHPRPSPPPEKPVARAVRRTTGAFAIGVLSAQDPNNLVAAPRGPPAVIGIGDGEFFLASDVPGILHHTRNIHFLQDGELAVLTPTGVALSDFDGKPLPLKSTRIAWDPIQAEKAGYKHFMLKEINEQPRAIRDTTLGRVSLDTGHVFLEKLDITDEELKAASQITIAACGTSWHAGLAGKFMIERLARVPVEVDYASEWRYRDPITSEKEIALLITQSGETADTIAAQRQAKQKGCKTLAICNVVGAMIAPQAAGTVYTHPGPEIGVASTKAFTAQLTALFR